MNLHDATPVRSILIVEDEAMIALMLEEYLDTLGHRIKGIATSIEEAEALIAEGGIDLAILDCYLGGDESWPVADLLAQKDIAMILSSGGSISSLPERYADLPLLQKPYTLTVLADLLKQIAQDT